MSVTALNQQQGEVTILQLHSASTKAAIQGLRIRSPTQPQNVTRRQRVGVSAAFLFSLRRRGKNKTEDRKMTKEKKQAREFKVALVRREEYEDFTCDTKRIVNIFTTYAKSEKQAINNVRFRNGGRKPLAYVGGGSHVLYDDYEILKEK